jgi:glycosyltransferase involved in cell wall biosynthesis
MDLILKSDDSIPTLCLNMIVKNESKIITRMFDSVVSVIDSYCICDTGSTDNTVEIIQEYFSKHNIPGKVVVEPFKNFCHNRNFALKSCIGMSDFVLLMDADMILDVRNFNKSMLKDYDSYNILQGNNNFYYYNLRILKNNGLYSYVGVTHEYINTPQGNRTHNMEKNTVFINDWGDGGCKSNKFERDITLLLDGIKEEPKNDRYHFYLANTYHDTNRIEDAITYYKKRIEFGGWEQEVWYSYYKMGCCYKKLDKIVEAINCWLDAYNYLPKRIENLYEIIYHYRIIGKQRLAMVFYEIADKVLKENHKRDEFLFLHNDVYTYKLALEYTIFSCYVGIKNINDQVVTVLNNCNDHSTNQNLLSNMKFYKDILKPIKTINLDKSDILDVNNDLNKFISSSSCLIPNDTSDGYIMNQRFVNYLITDKGNYLNCDKHIITYNKYVELDKNLNITKEEFFKEDYVDRRYIGVEDIKIFKDHTGQMKFIGTYFHKNNNIGISVGDYNICNKKLAPTEIKCSFNKSDCEKNWVYTNYKDETYVIYKWHPLQICKVDETSNTLNLMEEKKMPLIFSNCRGSSCGFKYKNEIWFVVHLVSYETPRHYYHMIAVFDDSLNLLRYSAPFKFEGHDIEYSLSIVVEDEKILMNYSMWDRTTRIGVYDKKYIESTFKKVEQNL